MNISTLLRIAAPVALVFLLVSCSKELEPITTGTMTDPRDGHVYKTVIINNDTWFAENLAWLPSVTYYIRVYGYEGTNVEEARQTENYQLYGTLYLVQAENADTLCPEGWHVSTDKEWERVEKIVGTDSIGSMKMKTKHGWTDGNNGTDELGLGLLPGGAYSTDGNVFAWVGTKGCFATSSTKLAWEGGIMVPFPFEIYRHIDYKIYRFPNAIGYLGSVRCVKD